MQNLYNIILFGLTGFGSDMLQYLINLDMYVKHIYTRYEKFEHPYFPVRPIESISNHNNISVSYGLPTDDDLCSVWFDVDLIISATFDKKIPNDIVKLAKLGAYNFHPSLLPLYKGATPTKECLFNNEKYTGVTVHKITDEFDSGEIIAQRKIRIEDYYNDGLLRQRLSMLQYPLLLDLFKYIEDNT